MKELGLYRSKGIMDYGDRRTLSENSGTFTPQNCRLIRRDRYDQT